MIFIARNHGTSKKGKPYDMVEVLAGFHNMTLGNVLPDSAYEGLKEGDEFEVICHLSKFFGEVEAKIVSIKGRDPKVVELKK